MLRQPRFERVPVQVGKPVETAFVGDAKQLPLDVGNVFRRATGGVEVRGVGVDMVQERRRLMIGNGVFGDSQHVRLDQFGAAFQVRQDLPVGAFVAAAGLDSADDAGAVPVLGEIGRRFGHDAVATVVADSVQRRSRLVAPVLPLDNPLALPLDDDGAGRQRSRRRFLEHRSHYFTYPLALGAFPG
jgi:hypothetical protein